MSGDTQGDAVGLGPYRTTSRPVGGLEGGQLNCAEEQ